MAANRLFRSTPAQVRHRTWTPRRRKADARPTDRYLPNLLRSPPQARLRYPVAPQLRHRRQDLLCLHRSQRRNGPRARAPGRLPRQPRLTSPHDDRPHHLRRL